MKVSTEQEDSPKQFRPFSMKINVETEEEAFILWHYLNQGFRDVVDKASSVVRMPLENDGEPAYKIWGAINGELTKQGYRED